MASQSGGRWVKSLAEIVSDLDAWGARFGQGIGRFSLQTWLSSCRNCCCAGGQIAVDTRFVARASGAGQGMHRGAAPPARSTAACQFIDCVVNPCAGAGPRVSRLCGDWLRRPLAAADVSDVLRPHVKGNNWGPAPRRLVQADTDKTDLPRPACGLTDPAAMRSRSRFPMFDASEHGELTAARSRPGAAWMEVMDYHSASKSSPWRFWITVRRSIGIREGARIVGDYVLTTDDLRAGRAFGRRNGRGTYYWTGINPTDDNGLTSCRRSTDRAALPDSLRSLSLAMERT